MARVLYLQADSGKNSGQFLIDVATRVRPVISDGTSLMIRLGAFYFDVPASLTNLATLNFEFRESSDDSETPFLTKDVTLPVTNETILLSAWNAGSAWNAEIEFTSEELDFSIPTETDYSDLWLIITSTRSDGTQTTLGAGTVRFSATNDSGATQSDFMLKSTYDSNNDGVVDNAASADAVAWVDVTSKPATFTPTSHSHVKADITDLADVAVGASGLVPDPVATVGKVLTDDGLWQTPVVAWTDITGKPATSTPTSHSHTKSDVTDLAVFSGAGAANLVPDPTVETGRFLKDDGTWGNEPTFTGAGATGVVPDPTAETGLFLKDDGTWAAPATAAAWAAITGKPATFTPASHTHTKSEITDLTNFGGAGNNGLVPDPIAAVGKFLQDDGSWSTPAVGTVATFTGAGATGVVPDPTAETGLFLKDDGTWAAPAGVATFTGAGATGVVPDPTAETGLFLKDDGTWAAPAGGATPKDVLVFEILPPDDPLGNATYKVTRMGLQMDVEKVVITLDTNTESIEVSPQSDGTIITATTLAVDTQTRAETTGMNNASFSGGAATTARIPEGALITAVVTGVAYGAAEGLWMWFVGEWETNQ